MTTRADVDGANLVSLVRERRYQPVSARVIGLASCVLSLATSAVLLVRHTNFGGPGDELSYYSQAAELLPFRHNWYGPSYFVALRLVHDLSSLSWFASGRVLSWLSACVVLLLCARLFNRLLPLGVASYALAIVALSPDFIGQSYGSLTIMYGTLWLVLPVLVLVTASLKTQRPWLIAGILFGIAALARFQATGFVLGAIGGVVLTRGAWRLRARSVLLLVGAFLLPMVAWNLFLRLTQGSVPPNYNFVNLAPALGQFESFQDVPALIHKYGSMMGLLRADPLNFPRIVAYGLRATLMFPFREAPQMLALAAAWIVPGLVIALAEDKLRASWFCALAMGLVLTGIGSLKISHYYLPALPLLAYLIAIAVESYRARLTPFAVKVVWSIVLCSILAWSAVRVPHDFKAIDWPEWSAARDYLNAHRGPDTKVVTTASSLSYDAKFIVLDQDTILPRSDSTGYLNRLRRVGATHLVVSERHSLWDYPWMSSLLRCDSNTTPIGLVLDTLIVSPHRVAIYHLTR